MMIFTQNINIFSLFIIILSCNNLLNTNGYPNQGTSGYSDVIDKVNITKVNLRTINLELDALHKQLHLQSDMIGIIRNFIDDMGKGVEKDQCDISESFDEIDDKLNKIKKKLHKTINDNDDKHLEKMDAILQRVKVAKNCGGDDSDPKAVEDIKQQISQKLKKFDQYTDHVQKLETILSKQMTTEESSNNKIQNLENIIKEINLKISSQESKLNVVEEHMNDVKNISSTVENHLNSKKKKSMTKCNKENKCILYHLLAMDKSLNLEKVNQ